MGCDPERVRGLRDELLAELRCTEAENLVEVQLSDGTRGWLDVSVAAALGRATPAPTVLLAMDSLADTYVRRQWASAGLCGASHDVFHDGRAVGVVYSEAVEDAMVAAGFRWGGDERPEYFSYTGVPAMRPAAPVTAFQRRIG